MKKSTICLLLSIVFMLSACSTTTDSDNTPLAVCAPEAELTITSSKEHVPEFISKNKNLISLYDEDECYNLTPDFIADSSEFKIFKYGTYNGALLLYDGEVYRMGEGFAMGDVISMALADINMDNQYELYYTFVSGSGMPYSITGYFDPVSKENTIFDYVSNINLMLTMNESGDLCVNNAVRERDWDSYVDSTIKAREPIGTVVFDKGEITLNID